MTSYTIVQGACKGISSAASRSNCRYLQSDLIYFKRANPLSIIVRLEILHHRVYNLLSLILQILTLLVTILQSTLLVH
jgi:hypothetical protein